MLFGFLLRHGGLTPRRALSRLIHPPFVSTTVQHAEDSLLRLFAEFDFDELGPHYMHVWRGTPRLDAILAYPMVNTVHVDPPQKRNVCQCSAQGQAGYTRLAPGPGLSGLGVQLAARKTAAFGKFNHRINRSKATN